MFFLLVFQLYMYQLFRSLAYIHSLGICHRDIKPQNLLLDPDTGVLKLCDFGSAKHLVKGEPNVSYICSRYYRAPELIFGAIDYTTKIGKIFIFPQFTPGMLCESKGTFVVILRFQGTTIDVFFLRWETMVEKKNESLSSLE